MDSSICRRYSVGEEVANWITHGAAALAAVGGLVVLAVLAAQRGDAWHIVGCSIFGATMVLLYIASTIYHAVPSRLKSLWQSIDQSAIYLLIAGSYTPFVLANLRTPVGWTLLGIVWLAAIVGIVRELTGRAKSMTFRVSIYVAMGWIALLAGPPILKAMPAAGLWLIAFGGVAYTSGLIFFSWRRLRYHHAIWHAFVIAGSTLHYLAVLFYVIPAAGVV